jgi:shikimate dehydrogenase
MSAVPRAGLLGHPVSHSLSPEIMRWLVKETRVPLDYELWDVGEDELPARIRDLSSDPAWVGANVTVPHKSRVLDHVKGISDEVGEIGAANVLLKTEQGVIACNTDKVGFRTALDLYDCSIAGRKALLVGAGGAARAVLMALLEGQIDEVTVLNRTASRAQALLSFDPQRVRLLDPEATVAFDLIINATSLGLGGDGDAGVRQLLGGVPDAMSSHAVMEEVQAVDLVYPKTGGLTPFLRWAESTGMTPVMHGLPMLAAQAVESFALWTGTKLRKDGVRDLVKDLAQ